MDAYKKRKANRHILGDQKFQYASHSHFPDFLGSRVNSGYQEQVTAPDSQTHSSDFADFDMERSKVAMETRECPRAHVSSLFEQVSQPVDPHFEDFQEAGQRFGPAVTSDELGTIGPYRVQSLLVKGGMGSVFLAQDKTLGRPIALKVIRPDLASNPLARERFLREARAAASIQHDHIVSIYHVGEEHGTLYLAMPLLSGRSLEASLAESSRPSLSEVLRIGREIAEGLAAAHENGLIHRDIKPANVWLEGHRERVKLLDFGLARSNGSESRLTQDGLILGTPAFMAPEQVKNCSAIDQRCDLFSLGILLYLMVTGRLPFEGPSMPELLLSIVNDEPVPPAGLRPGLLRAVNDLILRLLAKRPADRPASALEVVETILAIENPSAFSHLQLESSEPAGLSVSSNRNPPRRDYSWPWFLLSIALFAMALFAGSLAEKYMEIKAKLTIESPYPHMLIQVEQHNRPILLIKTNSQKNVMLSSGHYELKIQGNARGLKLEHNQLDLRSGETVYVRLVPEANLASRAPQLPSH